ncbi:MAG: hypothetical protein JW841_14355 [Deltaproteobacteria bacterium]|nr:hypothetical protein [Deltaproteobacteria bacterium]
MQHRFRSDLKCSREEQQGVVFYRIDDPLAQTSFRLYEIEYLIAQKLDGVRQLSEIITAVKNEYNFDISEPDLAKFINQLDSMGFIEKDNSPSSPSPNEDTTKVMDRRDVKAEGDAEIIEDIDLIDAINEPFDEAELKRLLKSALLHVRQGYLVHARDYFLAAKELNPQDAGLAKLVSHLEIIGDSSGPAEVDYLWTQACELYPELAAEISPLAETKTGSISSIADDPLPIHHEESNLSSRLLWLLVLVVLVGGTAVGLYYFVKSNHLFEGSIKTAVITLQAQRLPVYLEEPAIKVQAANEIWLALPVKGKIAEVKVARDARTQANQVLVELALPAPLAKQLKKAMAAVKKISKEYNNATIKLNKILKEREAKTAARDEINDKLEKLKIANLSTHAGAQKRELDRLKKARAKANKKLSQLAKRARKPGIAAEKIKQKLQVAQKKLQQIEAQVAQKQIRSPFAGTVIEVAVQVGKNGKAGQKAILLRDNSAVNLVFNTKNAGQLMPGAESFVSIALGTPSQAKIAAVNDQEGNKQIIVLLNDPAGSFAQIPPKEFRLVREFIERAYEIPTASIVKNNQGTHVLVDVSGRAVSRNVEVLNRNANTAIIRDKSGTLRNGERIIVERIDQEEGGVASIVDGASIEIQQQR